LACAFNFIWIRSTDSTLLDPCQKQIEREVVKQEAADRRERALLMHEMTAHGALSSY